MMSSCRVDRGEEEVDSTATLRKMEIGWPTEVRHVAHVTFDRFHGFLGLPVEFELEIPCRVPSASASVFGVSAESMQCCYDSKGNSVPTILLLMQERLYSQGGLKAWFRELPSGVLDSLSPEEVLNCNTEEQCVELVKRLLPTQAALLNWAVDLMTDVVEEEEANKMNARNIAMVFAPNLTQMADPLTALMHAVQVMNLLKTLILKTIREREEATMGENWSFSSPSSYQQSDDDSDRLQEVDMNGELREQSSDDDCVSNRYSVGESGGEDDVMSSIEECFLRRLEEKQEMIIDDEISRDINVDFTSQLSKEDELGASFNSGEMTCKNSPTKPCDDGRHIEVSLQLETLSYHLQNSSPRLVN
ncbi:hypothetical protein QJS10_CPA16g01461 [Acorus calamus]|uniref:Rho-GAP domain-containing protein n=1 Tax=Acorus calamus TaxID=4465 RepID=A0AAV9D2H5_ACOCL|nr:hypothetical protein QJS10_CPA16g01461 [Acorus calamus]